MSAVRVAVASRDGKNINEPFGRARKFYIYEVGEKIALREVREVEQENDHESKINLVQDCEILIASRIGHNVVEALFFSDVYPLIISEEIHKTLEKLRPRIRAFRLRDTHEDGKFLQKWENSVSYTNLETVKNGI